MYHEYIKNLNKIVMLSIIIQLCTTVGNQLPITITLSETISAFHKSLYSGFNGYRTLLVSNQH